MACLAARCSRKWGSPRRRNPRHIIRRNGTRSRKVWPKHHSSRSSSPSNDSRVGNQLRFASFASPNHGRFVWGFVKEEFQQATRRRIFFPSSVFFVRSESPFLRPDPHFAHAGARRSCQGWPSHQPSACFAFARPYLDSFEHDGTLGAIEMTIRGELRFSRVPPFQ